MSELRYFISRYANAQALDVWVREFEPLRLNRYERLACQHFFEESRRLMRARDAIDGIRDTIPSSPGTVWGWQYPNSAQQRALYDATKQYFDAFYSALSALSGVVARFSRVFGKNFSDNGPFIKWLGAELGGFTHGTVDDLDRARLFRAMLSHPQQFPVANWATACYFGNEHAHVVLYGPVGRGKNSIPRGATRGHPWIANLDDWQFPAPDEISVTNSLFNAGVQVFGEVMSVLTHESSLMRGVTRQEAVARLISEHVDVSPANRHAGSAYEQD